MYLGSTTEILLVTEKVREAFDLTDASIADLIHWPEAQEAMNKTAYYMQTRNLFEATLEEHRVLIMDKNISTYANILIYNEINRHLLTILTQLIRKTKLGSLWKDLMAFKMLVRARESFSITGALGEEYYLNGHLLEEEYLLYVKHEARTADHLHTAARYSDTAKQLTDQHLKPITDKTGQYDEMKAEIILNLGTIPSSTKTLEWVQAEGKYEDAMHEMIIDMEMSIFDVIKKRSTATDSEVGASVTNYLLINYSLIIT